MIWSTDIAVFYFVGFICAKSLGLSSLGIAVIGAAIALAAIAPHRSRCLALRSKASAGGQLFGVPLPTLTAKGGMPYDYIGNSIAFPDDHRTVGTSRKCCTSDGRPEKG